MRAAPPVTIVTPTWNGLPYVKECVESVLSQSYDNFEYLVSDDNSSDGTRDYLKSISDPRLHVFHQSQNLGIFGNLNFLFSKARCPTTYILCQDDAFLPSGLAKVVETWAMQPNDVAWIRFNFYEIDSQTCRLVRLQRQSLPMFISPREADLYFFVFGNFLGNLSNNLVRTELVAKAGGFDQEFPYAGDFEFWIRLAKLGSLVIVDDHVVDVREHPNQASFTLNRKGELVPQLYTIVDGLYGRLCDQLPAGLLRKHAMRYYDSPHIKTGIQQLIQGQSNEYLVNVKKASEQSACFRPVWRRLLECTLTAGGRFNRVSTGLQLLTEAARVEFTRPPDKFENSPCT